jgi:hypothetical protein
MALPGTVPGTEDAWRCRGDRGVGPAQHWNVYRGADGLDWGTRAYFDFQFGHKGLYGAPADLDAHVPRMSGGVWVNGLGAGTYYVRAFLWGYVQTLADGVTFEPVSFTVPSVEWHGDIYVPFDIRRCNYVLKEVHFHDVPGTMMESRIGWGWRAPWLNEGQDAGRPYTMAVVFWSPAKQEGYKVFTSPLHLSDGAFTTLNVFLEQSGVPIPEFPVAAIVLASALAASLFILRRRRRQ